MGKQQSKIGFLKNWFQDPQNNNIYNDIRTGQQARKYLVLISDLRQLKNYSLRIKQKNKFRVKVLFYHAIQNHPFDTKGTYFNVYSQNMYTIQQILSFRNKEDYQKYQQQKRNYYNQQQKNRINFELTRRQQWISKFSDIEIILNIFAGYRDLIEIYGSFRVNSNMIGVNIKGQVKLWVNQNFALNYPSSTTINQKIMLDDLIQTLKRVDLKRKIIPFISSQSHSQWEKIEDVIQFLQTRANAQNKNRQNQTLLNKYKNQSKPKIQMLNFYQNNPNYLNQKNSLQDMSPNKKRYYRPSMPSQQKRVSNAFFYQNPNMRACVSNDKKHFQLSPNKKQISYCNLYQNIPQNNHFNYLGSQLNLQPLPSYLSPRYIQLNNKNGFAKYYSPQSQKIHHYHDNSLGHTGYQKNKHPYNQVTHDDQKRGKTFNNFQQILNDPKISINVKDKSPRPTDFKHQDRKGGHVVNSMPNSCVVHDSNDSSKIQGNNNNTKYNQQGNSKFQPDYAVSQYYNTVRPNKSPNFNEKIKKSTDQNKNKMVGSIQALVPNMIQSRKLNFVHSQKRGSQQNSKKSSNIYQKEFQHKNFLNKDIQDSLIFMKEWGNRGKTQNFAATNEKKKTINNQPPKAVPGFLSKRKNSSNQTDNKKQLGYNQQMQDRRFTGIEIFEKSAALKRPSVEHESKNKTLGSSGNIKKEIPYFQIKALDQKMSNNVKNGGARDLNKQYILNSKYKYPYQNYQKVYPSVTQISMDHQQQIVQNYGREKKNQYKNNPNPYYPQGKYPLHKTQNIYELQQKQLAKKKSPMKNSQMFNRPSNYVNINQPSQFSEDNSPPTNKIYKPYERSNDTMAQSDPIYQKDKEKAKQLQRINNLRQSQLQKNKSSKFQFSSHQQQQNTQRIRRQDDQRRNSEQIKQMDQKQKKKKQKQEMMKMLSSQFGAVIGHQGHQQSHKIQNNKVNIKSPQKFQRTEQVCSANSSPDKNRKQSYINNKNLQGSSQIQKTKDQLIRQKVEQKKANFAQLKKQALQILSDDLF